MLLSCHYYITHMWSKFQNWHTIYTAAADHVFSASTRCGMRFFTSRNSKGWFSLKPLFLSAIKCHCLETWALSSGIHLTYMHIIKGGKTTSTQEISHHKRTGRSATKKQRRYKTVTFTLIQSKMNNMTLLNKASHPTITLHNNMPTMLPYLPPS